jgi:chemotaxis protein histidine kinase CheA
MMGGAIYVESVAGRGTTFTINLPCGEAAVVAAASPTLTSSSSGAS